MMRMYIFIWIYFTSLLFSVYFRVLALDHDLNMASDVSGKVFLSDPSGTKVSVWEEVELNQGKKDIFKYTIHTFDNDSLAHILYFISKVFYRPIISKNNKKTKQCLTNHLIWCPSVCLWRYCCALPQKRINRLKKNNSFAPVFNNN